MRLPEFWSLVRSLLFSDFSGHLIYHFSGASCIYLSFIYPKKTFCSKVQAKKLSFHLKKKKSAPPVFQLTNGDMQRILKSNYFLFDIPQFLFVFLVNARKINTDAHTPNLDSVASGSCGLTELGRPTGHPDSFSLGSRGQICYLTQTLPFGSVNIFKAGCSHFSSPAAFHPHRELDVCVPEKSTRWRPKPTCLLGDGASKETAEAQ